MKTVRGDLYILPYTGWAEVYRKNEQGHAEVDSAWLTKDILRDAMRHTRHECEVDLDDSPEGTRMVKDKPYYRVAAIRCETPPSFDETFYAKVLPDWGDREGPICFRSYCDNPAAPGLGLCEECANPNL